MEFPVILMNFTHVYEQESFTKNKKFVWIDCTDITGTDCYCDKDAMRILKERIAAFPPEGIHFIDSGNHHYMSKLWTDKITSPFSLVVFDHHPDMQPSFIMYTQFPAVAIFFPAQEKPGPMLFGILHCPVSL